MSNQENPCSHVSEDINSSQSAPVSVHQAGEMVSAAATDPGLQTIDSTISPGNPMSDIPVDIDPQDSTPSVDAFLQQFMDQISPTQPQIDHSAQQLQPQERHTQLSSHFHLQHGQIPQSSFETKWVRRLHALQQQLQENSPTPYQLPPVCDVPAHLTQQLTHLTPHQLQVIAEAQPDRQQWFIHLSQTDQANELHRLILLRHAALERWQQLKNLPLPLPRNVIQLGLKHYLSEWQDVIMHLVPQDQLFLLSFRGEQSWNVLMLRKTELDNLRGSMAHLHPLIQGYLGPHTAEYIRLFLTFDAEQQVNIVRWSVVATDLPGLLNYNDHNPERIAM